MPYTRRGREVVHDQWDSDGLFTADEIWSYPDFWLESEWIERCCEMSSGNALNSFFQARRVTVGLRQGIIGGLSRPSSGSCVLAVRGATCLLSLDLGIGRMCASPVEAVEKPLFSRMFDKGMAPDSSAPFVIWLLDCVLCRSTYADVCPKPPAGRLERACLAFFCYCA